MKRALITTTIFVALATSAGTVAAQEADDEIYPPDGEEALDASAFSGICEDDAPFVQYAVEPIGFTPTTPNPVTLTIRDVNGDLIEVKENLPLSGTFIYPGAAVGPDGKATDWPGWEFDEATQTWIELGPDEGDTIWRLGLDIQVDVNPTAFTEVDYPDATPQCSGPQISPPDGEPEPPQRDEASPPQGIATPPQQAEPLPATGSGPQPVLFAGALALVAGLMFLIAAHRRRASHGTTT